MVAASPQNKETFKLTIKKVAVIGPESTGKSTLSEALATMYDTVWVPEYARRYIDALNRPYTEDDLDHIAAGQLQQEDLLYTQSNQLLMCDTDLNVLKVWSEHAYGRCSQYILEQIATRKYDLYLLTYIDVAWQDDPQREHSDPEMRMYFYNQYRDIVMNTGVPWADIRGNHEERLQYAKTAINLIL